LPQPRHPPMLQQQKALMQCFSLWAVLGSNQ
jgi:hypothetical protein